MQKELPCCQDWYGNADAVMVVMWVHWDELQVMVLLCAYVCPSSIHNVHNHRQALCGGGTQLKDCMDL